VPNACATTKENLQSAIEAKNYEYPQFAKTAQKKNLVKITARFRAITAVEKHYKKRYKKLLKLLQCKTVFKQNKPIAWVCLECGYEHKGKSVSKICPFCDHAQGFYEKKCDNY